MVVKNVGDTYGVCDERTRAVLEGLDGSLKLFLAVDIGVEKFRVFFATVDNDFFILDDGIANVFLILCEKALYRFWSIGLFALVQALSLRKRLNLRRLAFFTSWFIHLGRVLPVLDGRSRGMNMLQALV